MKRSTASWTTAIAALALLAMPVGSWAQQTSPTPSQTTSRPSGAQMDQQGSANEHLRQAEAALRDIPAASLTGANKAKVAELKRHIGALGRTAASAPSSGKTSTAPAGKANWSTDVAAADRILTELLGAQSTTGATNPGMTGTTGSTSAKPGAQGKSSTPASATLDESARGKLQEVRTHLTAFAASMSGAGKTPGASTPSADDPASPASASAAAAPSATAASPASSAATAPATPSAQAPTPSAPSTAATPSEPSAAAATPSAQGQAAPAASPAQSADTEGVKRHLTAARDSLSQMTQLPAAAQLTGDARTQVSQLISNFNELITSNASWRPTYDKVQANLTALIGEQRADESPTPTAGTAGAVGTSGTTALDPAIRGKLVEFRTHLMEFEKAAGGGSSASAASPSAASSSPATPSPDPAAAAASSAAPAPASATTAASSSTSPDPASATTAASPSTSPAPAATPEPSPTGTSGRSSSSPSRVGTSGTTEAPPASATASAEPQERPSSAAQSSTAQPQGMSSAAMRHIEAIESILNGSASVGTTGSSEGKTARSSVTSLDRAQIEQIRTHLAALRKALNESK